MEASKVINNYQDKQEAIKLVVGVNLDKCPMEVVLRPYEEKRSLEQNRLQRLWFKELEAQGDQTAEEYRALSKLHFGVPILLYENETFAKQWEGQIKHKYSYEQKLEFMREPFDFPVTRLMTVKQKMKYLDKLYAAWVGKGYHLTEPRSASNA